MSQTTYIARKGADADLANVTVSTLTINGQTILATSFLAGVGEVVDLNGEADALILDAAQNVRLDGSSAGKMRIKISGAYDFEVLANIFRALSGSVIETNTINETTAASGVTIDSVLIKDGGAVFADGATIEVDTVNEATSAAGVTADGVLLKDGVAYTPSPVAAITADGAVTIPAFNKKFFFTKAGVAAMTIADPTVTTHDGVTLTFIATTANANTLDNSAGSGFFSSGGGTKDVATWGGAIGDRFTIVAYQGKWYIEDSLNITLG